MSETDEDKRIAELEDESDYLGAELKNRENLLRQTEARIAELENDRPWLMQRDRLQSLLCNARTELKNRENLLQQTEAALEQSLDGNRQIPDREVLGRKVREIWVRWARTQSNHKPSWVTPWDDMPEPDKEVDRLIGEEIARWALIADSAFRSNQLNGLIAERAEVSENNALVSCSRCGNFEARCDCQRTLARIAELERALVDVDEFEKWAQDGGYIDDWGEVEDPDDRFRCVTCNGRGSTIETVNHSTEKGQCFSRVISIVRKALAGSPAGTSDTERKPYDEDLPPFDETLGAGERKPTDEAQVPKAAQPSDTERLAWILENCSISWDPIPSEEATELRDLIEIDAAIATEPAEEPPFETHGGRVNMWRAKAAMQPRITHLSTGYTNVSWGPEIWAQYPIHFCGETIPDEYIFHPEWNRKVVNEWWAAQRDARFAALEGR